MKKIIIWAGVVLVIIIGGLGFWWYQFQMQNGAKTAIVMDPKNCTYSIEGKSVTLKNGSFTEPAVTGSATGVLTRYFGNEAVADVNGDGLQDTAFLLTQNNGGSGTFYYTAVALASPSGCKGTNAVLMGDRIAPQATEFSGGQIIVNYADRKPTEPMTATPSVGVSKYLQVKDGLLLEVQKTYGMRQYIDPVYHFSFWYPGVLPVTATVAQDSTSFPGGVAVETLQIGSLGGTSITVVNSPAGTITDEPNGHASPIAQTKYFYDNVKKQWMVAYPEGTNGQGSAATTVADVSRATMGGLIMLPSGKRFNTTIIPLQTTQFLVISDGGGSSFTSQLAKTVALAGALVDASAQMAALQSEANAYANQ